MKTQLAKCTKISQKGRTQLAKINQKSENINPVTQNEPSEPKWSKMNQNSDYPVK